MPPNEIISSVTEPPAPTARGVGEIVYRILTVAVDRSGNELIGVATPGLATTTQQAANQAAAGIDVEDFSVNAIIINAVVRYAPQRFPGAFPEITIVLDRVNKAFKLTVTDISQQYFGGLPSGGD